MSTSVTPPALSDWLRSDNTSDVMHNLAIVNARLSAVLAEILNLQKEIVSEVSERIKKISELTNEIRQIKFDQLENDSRANLATTKEESLRILRALKAFGVPNIDSVITSTLAGNGPTSVQKIWVDTAVQSLQAISESESNRSQQEGLRLQTFTNRYTQSGEAASSAIQKKGQSTGTIISNMRTAG